VPAVPAALALALALAGGPAAADQSSAQAEALFRQGKELMAANKLAEACDAFESSQKLEASPSTLLNLGNCRERNGQLATAWGLFVEVERQLREATDPRSQGFLKVAAERAARLEPRLSRLSIRVAVDRRPAGLEVRRDSTAVDPGAWDRPLPIDGGTYSITARAPGHAPWSASITIAPEGDRRTVEVPALAEVAEAPGPGPAPVAAGSTRRSRAAPAAIGAGALVLGGAALGFHLWGNRTYDRSLESTDEDERISLWHSANTRRYLAISAGAAAAGCAGVAVWLWLRSPPGRSRRGEASAGRAAAVAPAIAADHVGIVIRGALR
jgi:hypothetical protein